MTIKKLINRLQIVNPKTGADLLDMEIPLRKMGEGSFRNAYEVLGMGVVIKLPFHMPSRLNRKCVRHSLKEWQSYQKIKSDPKLKLLRKYLPTMYFCDEKTGLTLMKLYNLLPRYTKKWDKLRENLEAEVAPILKVKDPDVDNSGNVAVDERGRIKIIDLGYFDGY